MEVPVGDLDRPRFLGDLVVAHLFQCVFMGRMRVRQYVGADRHLAELPCAVPELGFDSGGAQSGTLQSAVQRALFDRHVKLKIALHFDDASAVWLTYDVLGAGQIEPDFIFTAGAVQGLDLRRQRNLADFSADAGLDGFRKQTGFKGAAVPMQDPCFCFLQAPFYQLQSVKIEGL